MENGKYLATKQDTLQGGNVLLLSNNVMHNEDDM